MKKRYWPFLAILALLMLVAGQAKASCISITSPANNAVLTGGVQTPIDFNDSCSSRWYECWLIDGVQQACATPNPEVFYWTPPIPGSSTSPASNTHTIELRSWSKYGTTLLGKADITVTIGMAQTLTISNPAAGSSVLLPQTVIDSNNSGKCNGQSWYDEVWIDGAHAGDAAYSSYVLSGLAAGSHTLQVFAHTSNPGGADCDSSPVISFSVVVPTPTSTPTPTATPPPPTPTPTPTSTPVPHYSVQPVNASLPSEATCAAQVDADPIPENASWNTNDGTGYDSNHQSLTVPSYFYQNAGMGLWYPNADFQQVDGAYQGSTDDMARVYSCKYGEDEDIMRAQMMQESHWHEDCAMMHGGTTCSEGGDCNKADCSSGGTSTTDTCGTPPANLSYTTSSGTYAVTDSSGNFIGPASNPGPITCNNNVTGPAASWSIIQNKSANAEWYTWPMQALSTSFGLDYKGAKFRSCMNNDSTAIANHFGANYTTDWNNAKSNPNSVYSGSEPTWLTNETNLEHLELGCTFSHFSGGWFDTGAISYGNELMTHYFNHDWPGGLQ